MSTSKESLRNHALHLRSVEKLAGAGRGKMISDDDLISPEDRCLIRRLRGLADYEHMDTSIGDEAADRIDELIRELR